MSKSRYDKEMSAVTYNMKEQRVLEKSLQTLKLEQTYALKLLELDNRIIKVHYKKLKEKVSKIKSHLPPEDISKFRELENQGKFKPTYEGVSLSSAVKIAAASRRLNLNNSRASSRRSIRSALPRISVTGEEAQNGTKTPICLNKPTAVSTLRRSNSITGVFIDAHQPHVSQRPGSAFVSSLSARSNGLLPERSKTAVSFLHEDVDISSPRGIELPNPHTKPSSIPKEAFFVQNHIDADEKRPSGVHHHPTHSPFSSHSAAGKDASRSGLHVPSPRFDQTRRMSHMSNDSIDSNLGENTFEERRQEMLEEECFRAETLDKRTKIFLKDVDEYLLRNPPLQPSHVAFETPPPAAPRKDSLDIPSSKDPYAKSNSNKSGRFYRRLERPTNPEEGPMVFPEEQYKQKLLALWKDINKCRYLRLPDDKIDLSGINTLARDQLRLFDALKQIEPPPITEMQ